MTHTEWMAAGCRLFGADQRKWLFVCPSCGHVTSMQDWVDVGAGRAAAFSCIGRYTGDSRDAERNTFKNAGGPCTYAGGGMIRLNPVEVDFEDGRGPLRVFAFATDSSAERLTNRGPGLVEPLSNKQGAW